MAELFKTICQDLQSAMKSKDSLRLETLRMMKSKILYVNARGNLPDSEIIKILSKYVKMLKEGVEEFKKVQRKDAAEKVEGEIKIVEEYLPRQLSEDEMRELVKIVISEIGATGTKDMGRVMKEVMARNPGAPGEVVNKIVREFLK